MSEDNFSFIDEILNPKCLRPDCKIKHRAKPEQAKQALIQGFKAAMLEHLPTKKTIPADSRYALDPFSYTKDAGYNEAIDDVVEALETLVNSKESKSIKRERK